MGDGPREGLPPHVKRCLTGYLQVPRIMDEDDVEKELVPEDEEEQFLNFNENKDDGQAGPSGEKLFEDNDYKEDN